jgi:hypothetical protein
MSSVSSTFHFDNLIDHALAYGGVCGFSITPVVREQSGKASGWRFLADVQLNSFREEQG